MKYSPSRTYNASAASSWPCMGGPKPGGSVASSTETSLTGAAPTVVTELYVRGIGKIAEAVGQAA